VELFAFSQSSHLTCNLMSDQLFTLLEISERELILFLKPAISSRLSVAQNRYVQFPLERK
jgi:hypothetical protein